MAPHHLSFNAKHNICAILDTTHVKAVDFAQAILFLQQSHIFYAVSENPDIYVDQVHEFWRNSSVINDGGLRIMSRVQNREVVVDEAVIRRVLHLDDDGGIDGLEMDEVQAIFRRLGYEGAFVKTMVKKANVSYNWRFLIHVFIHCLSARIGGFDEMSSTLSTGFALLVTCRRFNFSSFFLQNMQRNIEDLKLQCLLYPRFVQLILNSELPNLDQVGDLLELQHMNWKVFNNMKKKHPRSVFTGAFTPLFPEMFQVQVFDDVPHDVVATVVQDVPVQEQEGAQEPHAEVYIAENVDAPADVQTPLENVAADVVMEDVVDAGGENVISTPPLITSSFNLDSLPDRTEFVSSYQRRTKRPRVTDKKRVVTPSPVVEERVVLEKIVDIPTEATQSRASTSQIPEFISRQEFQILVNKIDAQEIEINELKSASSEVYALKVICNSQLEIINKLVQELKTLRSSQEIIKSKGESSQLKEKEVNTSQEVFHTAEQVTTAEQEKASAEENQEKELVINVGDVDKEVEKVLGQRNDGVEDVTEIPHLNRVDQEAKFQVSTLVEVEKIVGKKVLSKKDKVVASTKTLFIEESGVIHEDVEPIWPMVVFEPQEEGINVDKGKGIMLEEQDHADKEQGTAYSIPVQSTRRKSMARKKKKNQVVNDKDEEESETEEVYPNDEDAVFILKEQKYAKRPEFAKKQAKSIAKKDQRKKEKRKTPFLFPLLLVPADAELSPNRVGHLRNPDEAKYREEMKKYLKDRGFNTKRFGKMKTDTMEKHMQEEKVKESMEDPDVVFTTQLRNAIDLSTQPFDAQQQPSQESKQSEEPEQQQQQQQSIELYHFNSVFSRLI